MFFKKKENTKVTELTACVSGLVIPLKEVKDEVFASGSMGGGLGIEPKDNIIVAPCNGTVTAVMEDTKHAVGLTLDNGAEILIHVGINTVEMGGVGFKLFVNNGAKIKAGDKLIQFDADLIREKGFMATCMVILLNESEYPNVEYISGIQAEKAESVIMKFNKE